MHKLLLMGLADYDKRLSWYVWNQIKTQNKKGLISADFYDFFVKPFKKEGFNDNVVIKIGKKITQKLIFAFGIKVCSKQVKIAGAVSSYMLN